MANEDKSQQLGMPFGTASARLRKSITFHLLERLGETNCYRCGGEMSEDDFSIEHKMPWLHGDVENFWNLDNISFSHVRCNTSAARKKTSQECPKGHPMSGENLRITGKENSRQCRACGRERWHRLELADKRKERRQAFHSSVVQG